MPVTQLDKKTALIVVDLQKGIVAYPVAHPIKDVIGNAALLIAAFRRYSLPVVLVNVTGGAPGRTEQPPRGPFPPDFAELIPELEAQPQDHYVTKKTWGAFAHTDLAEHLKKNGITQVVIAGVATSVGVESTAREAFALGFNVTLVTDAMTDMNADTHHNSVTRIFPKLGEVGVVQDVITLLEKYHG